VLFDCWYFVIGYIYTYIICSVAMPRIVELLQIVEEKRKSYEINMDISVLSSFPKYKSQIQRMMIPSLLFTFLHMTSRTDHVSICNVMATSTTFIETFLLKKN